MIKLTAKLKKTGKTYNIQMNRVKSDELWGAISISVYELDDPRYSIRIIYEIDGKPSSYNDFSSPNWMTINSFSQFRNYWDVISIDTEYKTLNERDKYRFSKIYEWLLPTIRDCKIDIILQ
jgi:hypothetical protein